MLRRATISAWCLMLFFNSPALSADSASDFFEKRIRPLLVKHCIECHGPDEASGKLRLDSKAGWVRGGKSGPSIVPGDPSSSLLYRAVARTDKQLVMPPDSKKTLTRRQIDDIAFWIRQGAFDSRTTDVPTNPIARSAKNHWAFQPVKPPQVLNPSRAIDELIDRQLQKAGFKPTAPADMRTLIRRSTYDLIGLPPTAKQLATTRAQFPRLIDELLASPHYGERWGRHWLDVARYSDAKDGVLMYGDARIRPFAYTYRDYVIRAFNADKPFDDFVREQIAADHLDLPADSPDLAAMGFLTLGRMFDRNPHDVIDDRIDVVTRGFLGLTLTCARCHDHKFDPLPTADYYSLYGVFANSVEPYKRPRVEPITKAGQPYEAALSKKLDEVFTTQQSHYDNTLQTARERTVDYLVQVATTEPDISETSIFFLSLLPDQLRPQITYRWRKLIAQRAFAGDAVFGPWHDLMNDRKLRVEEWRRQGVEPRIIAALQAANPQTPAEIARVYGTVIREAWSQETNIRKTLAKIKAEADSLEGGAINLADIVGGGNGFGTGKRQAGIHPATGEPTTDQIGFIDIKRPDLWIAVPSNKFIDGVFVPKSKAVTVSSTGLKIQGLAPTTGATWDYFSYGPSSGSTVTTIDGVNYAAAPNSMLGIHANKGITFDIQTVRTSYEFGGARFKAIFGHAGAKGQSQLDFAVYVDGRRLVQINNFAAQQRGKPIDIELPAKSRFLTLVVTEGAQGISHDQAILGNPRIVPNQSGPPSARKRQRLATLAARKTELERQLKNLRSLDGDPLAHLLVAKSSPVWFPKQQIYYYLSRKQKDAFRGLVGQLDSISVKHKSAAARAMVLIDSESIVEPVIFQRGDPGLPGNRVPRWFLEAVSTKNRKPFANGSGRLDLANEITAPHNPLTARVWANRIWQHHFGEPLVENPSDFGLRTQQPVHLELLDYLASKLVQNKWRTKPLHRLIMKSDAYQRASVINESAQLRRQQESDPSNKLLWHANRRRLDLEQMRDTMLVLAGHLDRTMFGRPSSITDINNKRRTIYSFVERQNIPNVVSTFDFANADTSTARRVNTIVPQQSLYSMNSNFVGQTAQAIARQVTSKSKSGQISQVYQISLGRQPTAQELSLALEYLKTSPLHQFAQILLMTNELMFVD